ncbi:MAG: general secretion pathway protein D [Parvibaculaceae bacterium]
MSTKSWYANIKPTLKRLDVRPLQALIETSIAEVTLSDELKYGVQYYLQSGNFSALRTATTSLTPAVPVPGFAMLFSTGQNEAILDLLESKTKVHLLSAPCTPSAPMEQIRLIA